MIGIFAKKGPIYCSQYYCRQIIPGLCTSTSSRVVKSLNMLNMKTFCLIWLDIISAEGDEVCAEMNL